MDATALGDVNVDILTSNLRSLPKRDEQVIMDDMRITTGGCAANFAKAYATLGSGARLIAKVGDDAFGRMIDSDLRKVRGLDLRLLRGSRTAVTLALTFRDKTRSFITYPGANGELSIKDVDSGLIEGRFLHVASFFLQGLRKDTKKVMDIAHSKGMLVSFDTGFDPRGWSEADVSLVRKILKDVDVFFPNLAEGRAITGAVKTEDVCDDLLSLGASVVALKMGAKGSVICSGENRVHVPPCKVRSVDSTGAGDVFGAAFVYGSIRGWDLKKAGRFANAAAALSTLGFGSESYPSAKEALRLSGLV